MTRSAEGQRRVTISDIALLAGCSKATVSKAVNNQPGISEEARQRVLKIAELAGWRPSARAVALAGRTRTVGFILDRRPDLLAADPYHAELVSGIESVLARHGYWLLLRIGTHASPEEEAATYRELAHSHRVDGVLVAETSVDDYRFGLVKELGLPAVVVSRPWSPVDLPWEGPEHPGGGMDEAVRHLVARGRDRIAYVCGPPSRSYVVYRTRTLVQAVADCGTALVGIRQTDASAEEGFAATAALLAQPQPPTAILYDNDQMALAGCRAINAAGLRIPDDVAVVGHDDLSVSRWFTPALTTVSQDVFGLGVRCATRLLGILGEQVEEPPAFADPVLVVRESAG
ncbi:DNA-binding transcriptional regulator, LacI/PurR family [Microlunatus sagamiharensis]|uniref:DNA-binding transcriptional regulator, LacI/PurR family n=1 Tax=Microlunatus sagamiharensis TaxID=546874 RepID=A0A1H2MUT0_9ACTN|nr:LacI family DNA-binding transcriptional regulator [Microlunatus sagamiharensis]SDU96738.1 DNA-binding transcriptional regulator, LacI/PurR family [Microlunatus sagamiharensis]